MKKILVATLACALMGAWGSALAAGDAAAGKAKSAACAGCHGPDGNSAVPMYPKIAGQNAQYLESSMKAYKAGERTGGQAASMKPMVAALSDQDMVDVSYYFASQKANKLAATNQETLALGEKIWRGGIASRAVPACAACHAPNGAGMPVKYPRLAGQKADYTELQLKDFRDGVRKNDLVMPHVVNGMNDAQIKAVADFIQGLR